MTEQGLIRPLFDGPLDIIGDVHGEIDALRALLVRLGYDEHGEHSEGRRLVFVGDLCDRGPDSPAVIRLVRGLVRRELAQYCAGNHELNLLRKEQKHGNHWYFPGDHSQREETFGSYVQVSPTEAAEFHEFLATLPVALERPDLRVVHACWSNAAIEACRGFSAPLLEAYESCDRRALESPDAKRMQEAHNAERDANHKAMQKRRRKPPMLHAVAAYEEYQQVSNPLRVLTSGIERVTKKPFSAGGKWRFVERVPWWKDYCDDAAVVFGHYWRWWRRAAHKRFSKGEPNLFLREPACGWHRNRDGREVAFCIDYSVGARFKERKLGRSEPFHGRLAALRWPERKVVFDHPVPG